MTEQPSEFKYTFEARYGRTGGNLMMAFRREAESSARYAFYAEYAKERGYSSVASLFYACGYSERIHAIRHAKTALFIGVTVGASIVPFQEERIPEMLSEMLVQATLADLIYPDLIEEAIEDRNELAVLSFKLAMQSERMHIALCRQAIESPDYWRSERKQFFVCSLCGNTRPVNRGLCDSCGGAIERFIVFDSRADRSVYPMPQCPSEIFLQ